MSATVVPFSEQAFGYDYAAQPKEEVTACPLCSCIGFVEVATRDRYGYSNPTHVCAQCGLAFLNPRMTREAYSEFYAGTYRKLTSAIHGKEFSEDDLRTAQGGYGRRLAEFLDPLMSAPKSILDLGGGNGAVARVFADRYGARATVVDPSSDIHLANGCASIMAFMEDWKPAQAYELVLMCQTLDHALNPRGALEVARAALADDGVFYVDIVDWLTDGTKARDIRAGIKIDHPYGWTEGVMTAALVAHGFGIVRMRYTSNGRHVGYACRKVPLGRSVAYNGGAAVLARVRDVMTRAR